MNIDRLKEDFFRLYGADQEGAESARVFMAPGRVNLIGEYTDFNGGQVFPCALDFGTYAVARKTGDGMVHLASKNFEYTMKVDPKDIRFTEEDDWCNYPKGVLKFMREEGYHIGGMEILFEGNIPNGAGLSSSASIEVLTGILVDGLYGNGDIDRVRLAKISQKAENQFVGVNCGIMDQFAISAGKKGMTLLLKCDTLEYELGAFDLNGYSLVIMNSNKRRALNESKYNERRDECERALADMNAGSGKQNTYLCDYTGAEFVELEKFIKDKTAAKRAEHVIMENERVTKAALALRGGDLMAFGSLLKESHRSLKDLLEVSGRELDILVEEANGFPGCIGARMTGAGFGGCAIGLVETSEVEAFMGHVEKKYTERTGLKPDFYRTTAGDGAHEIV